MIKGIDSYSDVTDILPTLKEQGYTFVIRYYSLAANYKRMSDEESTAIWRERIKRVVVYQNKHNAYEKFSSEIAQENASESEIDGIEVDENQAPSVYKLGAW